MNRREKCNSSTFAFALPSVLTGAAQIVNPFGGSVTANRFIRSNDADALAADWAVVGSDMWKAVRTYQQSA